MGKLTPEERVAEAVRRAELNPWVPPRRVRAPVADYVDVETGRLYRNAFSRQVKWYETKWRHAEFRGCWSGRLGNWSLELPDGKVGPIPGILVTLTRSDFSVEEGLHLAHAAAWQAVVAHVWMQDDPEPRIVGHDAVEEAQVNYFYATALLPYQVPSHWQDHMVWNPMSIPPLPANSVVAKVRICAF